MPIRDDLKFFKLAFYSILSFTDYPYMLTIVDNMSGYSTRQYLETIRRNHQVNILQYQEPHSSAAEWNLGLKFMFSRSAVRYGVVLTPDIVVEPNWLSKLVNGIELACSIISPRTNTDESEPRAFCTAFQRSAYERIGGFDELFHEAGPTMVDFGDRARKAGFLSFNAPGVYVHHFARTGNQPDPILLTQDEATLKLRREVPA